MSTAHKLTRLADYVRGQIVGRDDCEIKAVNTLSDAESGDIAFLSNHRYAKYLPTTQASAVILSQQDVSDCPTVSLVVEDPYLAYAKIAQLIYPELDFEASVDKTAVIGQNCQIDEEVCISAHAVIGNHVKIDTGCYIGPGVTIGDYVSIGSNSYLGASVSLCREVQLGRSVRIHPGAVIGSDGFGIAQDKSSGWVKVPQIGSVMIEDNVEIGANTTIDRGAIGNTVIEEGVKIDNQVQIAHNVRIGAHTVIAGCVGIAGSTTIGKRCMLGGAVGINGHIEIVDDVVLTAMSGVSGSIRKPGIYSSNMNSVVDNKTWRRNVVQMKKLDQVVKTLKEAHL